MVLKHTCCGVVLLLPTCFEIEWFISMIAYKLPYSCTLSSSNFLEKISGETGKLFYAYTQKKIFEMDI